MMQRKWISKELDSIESWNEIKNGIAALRPKVAAFDTETTGLHIVLDKPFIFQFGFLHPNNDKGYTFLVDLRYNKDAKKIIREWLEIAKTCDVYLGHNVKFDLHMLKNIGIEYDTENLSDTQFYIRWGSDSLHTNEGGPPLSLKDYAARYVDGSAKYHEKLLASQRSNIAKEYNIKLKQQLNVTLKTIQELFKDPLFDAEDLPDNLKPAYFEWKASLPKYLQDKVTSIVESDMIRYSDLNRETLYRYAHLDIVYTLEIYEKVKPVVEYRQNMKAVELENKLIFPLLSMERTGFLADKEYLESCRKHMKEYTISRRKEFAELAGYQLKVGQHAEIKRILQEKFKLEITSTNNSELETVKSNLIRNDPDNPAIKFIDILSELRTLEKWYSTYIIRFQKELKRSDRLYTTIHSVGTVSGRVTSDFQQFPKEAIIDKDGNELFHPRKLVMVPPDCRGLLYLDYSQIELRFQAIYTILVGHPDLNMCRAYMPYKCHKADGTKFDFRNHEHIKHWNDEWFTDESNERWTPTDVHAATTEAAGYSKTDPDFKHYRKTIGKRVNFAKNYGASLGKIMEMFPDRSVEECKRIDAAYYTAFPGIKAYHQYCYDRAAQFPYTTNLFGIRYYNISGHKLRNTLVQGSAAHFLKYRIRALYEYMQKNHLSSRFQMQIHDELVFEIKKDDPIEIIKTFKSIMEDWPDALVPIIAEAEWTTTNWAEKKDYEFS